MSISSDYRSNAYNPPASPSARGLLRNRAQKKAESAAVSEIAKRNAEAAELSNTTSSLLTTETLDDSDEENFIPQEESVTHPPYSNVLVREEEIPLTGEGDGKFHHRVKRRCFVKVSGERALVPFADPQEAMQDSDMGLNKVARVIAECLWGRQAPNPHFSLSRFANPERGYTNSILNFVPLMTRFRQALNDTDFDELQAILQKSKSEPLDLPDLMQVNAFYEKVKPVPGGDFSWD